MRPEIERKFLVHGSSWKEGASAVAIRQGYLSIGEKGVVRVRVQGDLGFLTIKSRTSGISRAEFEYSIPLRDATALLMLCVGGLITKTRYHVESAGTSWSVDVFDGASQGLVVAEIELESEDGVFERPDWLGKEVSHDHRYSNSSLSVRPYDTWKEGLSAE